MPTAVTTNPHARTRKFALRAAAWGLGLFGVLRLPWIETHFVLPLTQWQGRAAALASGATVLPVDVTLACSGTELLAICAGAILAYPTRWRARVAGAAIGVGLILTLNTLRIGTLAAVVGSPALFNALHLYVWPAALALAVAAYVFAWMRVADRPLPCGVIADEPAPPGRASRRFVILTASLILVFAAASPLYLNSEWVLAAAAFIARTAAFLLRTAGVAAIATDSQLVTARGGVLVTQECITTPLIPVYIAAVLAYAGSWRARGVGLAAVVPLFIALGVARLLVVALPGAVSASPLFLIHAFYQLLTAVVVTGIAAYWRHDGSLAWKRAAAAVAVGALALYALGIAAGALLPAAPPIDDAQGAIALLPAFQIAFFCALWVAVSAPAGWRLFAVGVAVLALSHAALFAALHGSAVVASLATNVRDVRAWSLAAPILLMATMRMYDRPRR